MKKILSISIAAYNVEEFLRETVESIITDPAHLDQLEVLIVNDGSKDRTPDIAYEFQEKYPETIVVVDKANGGYGSTVNTSIKCARGKYFKLLDGDDRFDTENLCRLLDYLSAQDVDLVISPWIITKEGRTDTELVDKHPDLAVEPVLFENAEFGDGIAMFEVCIKTGLLRYNDVVLTEHCFYTDNEFVMAAELNAETVVRFPYPIYYYRLGVEGQSVSVEGRRRHFRDCSRAMRGCCRMYNKCYFEMRGGRKYVTDILISVLMRELYMAYMLQLKPLEFRDELSTIDRELMREFSLIETAAGSSKVVRQARSAGRFKYLLLCRYLLYKERKRTQ